MRKFTWIVWLMLSVLVFAGQSYAQDAGADTLAVTQVLPEANTAGIQGNDSITIIFNRPVIPLVTSIDMATLPQPLIINPAVEGKGEWLNTSIYVFKPDTRYRPATTYTVTVKSGLEAADGTVLKSPYQFSFTTAATQITRIDVDNSDPDYAYYSSGQVQPDGSVSGIVLEPTIWVLFDQPVERDQAEAQFYFRPLEQSSGRLAGTFEWRGDDNTAMTFTPDKRLAYDSTYQLGFETGELVLTGQVSLTFTTVPFPAILETLPREGEVTSSFNAFHIQFSTPMDEQSFEGKIKIEPEPDKTQENYQYFGYSIFFPMKARTDYTFTIAPGLKDIYGSVIDTGLTVHFSTPPLSPSLSLFTPSWIGFYNAFRPETGLYLNHMNVGKIGIRLYDISTNDFMGYLQGEFNDPFKEIIKRSPMIDLRLQDVDNPEDTYSPTFLSLGGDKPLSPGLYLLRVNALNLAGYEQRETSHFMMVMTANLTVKASLDKVWVWATNVNTGEPIADAPITIYGKDHGVIAFGHTDADGMLEVQAPTGTTNITPDTRIAVLNTGSQFGLGSTNWADGLDPAWFDQDAAFYAVTHKIYAYTDRPVYRPGQKVYFRAVVRDKDDMTYTSPGMETLPVQIIDSQGNAVYSQELSLSDFGTLNGEFEIGDEAPLGFYRVVVDIPEGSSIPNGEEGWVGFSVAEYHLPTFHVDVTPNSNQVAAGDTIETQIDSLYYSGGAVSNAAVDYTVLSQPSRFNYVGKGHYWFDNYDPDDNYYRTSEEIAQGTAETDSSGNFVLETAVDLSERPFTQTYTIEANIRDDTGQTVSGRTQVTVHTGRIYVGASPEHYVNDAGRPAVVNLIAVDWDSKPVADQAIQVEVVEKRWNNVQEVDEAGRTTWTWELEEIPVADDTINGGEDGKAVYTFTPPRAGAYEVRLSARDADGNVTHSVVNTWATGKEYVWWRQENNNRIELIADKENYQVGDTAEILIASPFQGTTEALITVERAGVMKVERVTMTSNSYVYHLPIQPEYAPNAFVSVMLVKGVDENNRVASFRMGLIQLQVDRDQKAIQVDITADHDEAAPGDTVHYTVHTTDFRGEPVRAEVGVSLTDLASLALADPNSPPLLDSFYSLQGLGIRTGTPLTLNVDQLSQNALDSIKGGGGGGPGVGIMEVRENFVDTPYWNPALVTDDDGTATFEVTLPDNLTTWRIDARAVTSGDNGVTLVGQNTLDLISTRPLIVHASTPRFFVVDDAVTLGAVVDNNTAEMLTTDVTLQATGVTIADPLTQTVRVAPGGHERVEWKVTVSDVKNVELVFSAVAGEYSDATRPPLGLGDDHLLPVYRYEAPETVATAGILREGGEKTELINLPADAEVTRGELSIHLEPSLAVTTISGLDYLKTYPYYCIEQTVSRFLPNIITYRALADLGVENAGLKADLDYYVSVALQRLYALQKVDGGWGWFAPDASNPLTTAYALIGLVEAKRQEFPVQESVIMRAQGFLQTTFIVPDVTRQNWELNRQAFVLYALARTGSPDMARMANLYEVRDRLNVDARAFLALGLATVDPQDARAATLLSDLVSAAKMSATGTHWEEIYPDYWNWSTNIRSTAIVLQALITLRPDSDLIPNAVRWLVTQRKTQYWETTQETAWAVMALTDWMSVTGELKPDYTYSAVLNQDTLAQGEATAANAAEAVDLKVSVADLLKDESNRLQIERSTGNGNLYYTARLDTYLPVPQLEPLNKGIIVERLYTQPDAKTLSPVSEARVGEIVQVRLTIIAPSDLYYVAIEDPIPAGAEAINPGLNTNQQIGVMPGLDRANPLWRGWGWWWFSQIDFHDEKTVLYASYLPAGTYEYVYSIRAAIPGTYNVIPTTGQEFYFPEVYGRGAGNTFTITAS